MAGGADELAGVAERALERVRPGDVVGLGTGRAANAFVRALGARVRAGMPVSGVPTSDATAALAREVGIPLVSLEEAGELATTFDGADEVAPDLDVIKGYGGAHVREKIVAASSRSLVILVGDEKIVGRLGERGRVPIEVLPFGLALCRRRLRALGLDPVLRLAGDEPWRTDNGNLVIDAGTGPIADPRGLEAGLLAIPGVVGTGLFLGMADAVIVQRAGGVEVLERHPGVRGRG